MFVPNFVNVVPMVQKLERGHLTQYGDLTSLHFSN